MKESQINVEGTIISIKVPLSMRRHGGRKLIILPENVRINAQVKPEHGMVKALARAWQWQKELDSGRAISIEDLSKKHNINTSYVCRTLRLNMLAPHIKQAILDGTQPRNLNLMNILASFPDSWEEQVKWFGFS